MGNLVEFGGGYQYVLSVINALKDFDKENYEIRFVIYSRKWQNHIQNISIQTIYFNEKKIYKAIRKIFYYNDTLLKIWHSISSLIHPLYKLFKSLNPDLIIFPSEIHYSFGTAFPTLMPIHDLMHKYERKFAENIDQKEFNRREFTYRNACRYASGILADSELGKEHIWENYNINKNKVFVLPYTIPPYLWDSKVLKNSPTTNNHIDKLPENYIFYPATLWEHKNHKSLLEAVNILKKKNTIINVVLTGSKKNAAESIFSAIEKLRLVNQVFYFEYVTDSMMYMLYKNALALVMPTYFGPTNIPPLEAFAVGCPVIISDIYAMKEQVGEAAILINPQKPHEIADAIESIYLDPDLRCRLIKKGYEQLRKWDVSSFNNRLKNIITEIL